MRGEREREREREREYSEKECAALGKGSEVKGGTM